jgi:hypothetical protein
VPTVVKSRSASARISIAPGVLPILSQAAATKVEPEVPVEASDSQDISVMRMPQRKTGQRDERRVSELGAKNEAGQCVGTVSVRSEGRSRRRKLIMGPASVLGSRECCGFGGWPDRRRRMRSDALVPLPVNVKLASVSATSPPLRIRCGCSARASSIIVPMFNASWPI